MASQSEAPDDLIAELARLMADEKPQAPAKPESQKAPTLRIPGDDRPAFDLRPQVEPRPVAAAPPRPIRIPGSEPVVVASEPPPFSFDFDSNVGRKPAGPASNISDRAPPQRVEPTAFAPVPPSRIEPPVAEEAAALDGDSLADLIAAELANDLAPAEPEPAPELDEYIDEPEIPVVDGPPRGPDNFGVSPVFGLGTTTVVETELPTDHHAAQEAIAEVGAEEARTEPDSNDPLAQIERLVGPAVNLSESAALGRSRATPTLPEAPATSGPASERAPRGNFDSVDEAILAAAAATGAQVEWVDDAGAAEEPKAEKSVLRGAPTPIFGLTRAIAGPLVAVTLLVVAGVGLYWVLGQGSAPTGPAPLIVADTAAVKETPAPSDTTPEQSVVFNEISGVDTGSQEQIVSRDQTDIETVSQIASAGTMGTDPTSGVTDPNQDGLVNRKVRTVTVRPDGTIVTGDDSVAGTAMLPVDRPNVPEVPGADFSTPDLIASASAEAETAAAATPAASAGPVVEAGANVAVADATGAVLPGRSVTIPRQRPDNFQQLAATALATTQAAPAPATPAATPAPVAETVQQPAAPVAASGGTAASYVQMSSQRSEEAARQTAQQIATRYGVLFGGANLEIQRVDLGERGIYYRVLVPADSRGTATNICANVKAAGGDCVVL